MREQTNPTGDLVIQAESRPARRPSEIYQKPEPSAAEPWQGASLRDRALIGLFLAAITLPGLGMLLHLDAGFKLEENRTLAEAPAFALKRSVLSKFPADFEAYFNDHFAFRPRLIRWLNYSKVAGLGVAPSDVITLGKNQWIYYGDVETPYYRAVTPLTTEELNAWQRVFENRRDWLAQRGIPYLVVFTCNKSTIYSENMPDSLNRVNEKSRLDQLVEHLQAHSTVPLICLKSDLMEAKIKERIYYRTDSHWNQRGAFVGYTRIMEALSRWYPQLQPRPRSEFREVHYSEPGRDLSLLTNLRDYYHDEYEDLEAPTPRIAREVEQPEAIAKAPGRLTTRGGDIVYETGRTDLPHVLMFRDSFATWLIPFMADHFQKITFSWQYTMDRQLVELEKPDFVIQEMVERMLMDAPRPYQDL